ncbi:hypothetical protein BGZ80_005664 [Entomortierella chlamydospora]|uniref:G domain-containing protein n=1 Tax=Entomortierella chlamydospora TaxID=101097 RepID=A0A9P6MZB1_9FUNG|nr:hypothetical protein BGZ79_006266 [Entomortierella chlamydospora]KAG0019533.1 hypothetical protein BGZ80_005664 [Entomortierella chlamydospora]
MSQEGLAPSHVYNIVLFGETQSGKSTFVEAIKRYANRSYEVNYDLIGNGIESHTTRAQVAEIDTELPMYEVYNTIDGSTVEYADYVAQHSNLDEYQEAINQRKDLDIRKRRNTLLDNSIGSRAIVTKRFNIYDTPGLNDSNLKDEDHVAELFRLLRHENTIDMVLLMVAPGPFHPSLVAAIKFYVSMFPEFGSIFAFVHTHTKYESLHPRDTDSAKSRLETRRILHDILGRATTPHFMIDCDLSTNKPIRECMTLCTIWKILSLAEFNGPVSIETMAIYKTPRMQEVDNVVKETCHQVLQEQQNTLRFKDEEEGELLTRVCQLESKILRNSAKRWEAREYIRRFNTNDYHLIHETRYESDLDTKPLWYPFTLSSGPLDHTIVRFNISNENTAFRCDFGDKRQSYFVVFRVTERQNAYIHVKAFVHKRKMFQLEIDGYREKLRKYAKTHEVLLKKLSECPEYGKDKHKEIQPIFDIQKKYLELERLMSSTTVSPTLLATLLEADAYTGSLAECAAKVERICLDCISKGSAIENEDDITSDTDYLVEVDSQEELCIVNDGSTSENRDRTDKLQTSVNLFRYQVQPQDNKTLPLRQLAFKPANESLQLTEI